MIWGRLCRSADLLFLDHSLHFQKKIARNKIFCELFSAAKIPGGASNATHFYLAKLANHLANS